MKIHHVGYLVKNIKKSVSDFEALGFKACGNIRFDETRNVDIVFLKLNETCIELINPHSDSEIAGLLNKFGNSPYHICYEVSDITRTADELKRKGFMVFKDTALAPAISERARVSFLISPNIGIVELLQL